MYELPSDINCSGYHIALNQYPNTSSQYNPSWEELPNATASKKRNISPACISVSLSSFSSYFLQVNILVKAVLHSLQSAFREMLLFL